MCYGYEVKTKHSNRKNLGPSPAENKEDVPAHDTQS